MAGGAVGTGVIVDLSQLGKLEELDGATRVARVQPGVLCKALDDAARKTGLRFPVDPSSAAFCTIGGMIATNAAGAHSLKFGSTREWVRSLDCVFADGSRATIARGERPPNTPAITQFLGRAPQIRREWGSASRDHASVRKDSSGYALGRYFESADLVDLLVGSEGTLAIVVGAELNLAPAPNTTSSLMAAFSSLEDAARGAEMARSSGASACELLDKTFLDVAAAEPESTPGSQSDVRHSAAILLIEIEAETDSEGEGAAIRLRTALEKAGATTVDVALTAQSEKEIWDLRHAASPILSRLRDVTSMQFIEDGAVPPEKLPEYVIGVRAALARRSMEGVIFGHAGDAHVHVNPLIDVTAAGWREDVDGLLEDVVALTARLKGTLSGEHGDGRLRTPLMERVWSAGAVTAFAMVKSAFDPKGVLNPGVKVPLAGQSPLGTIKYDPDIAPLPPAARKALDDLVSRRGYAESRLSLIDGIS